MNGASKPPYLKCEPPLAAMRFLPTPHKKRAATSPRSCSPGCQNATLRTQLLDLPLDEAVKVRKP